MADAGFEEQLNQLRGTQLANSAVLHSIIFHMNSAGHLPRDTWVSAVNYALDVIERMQATSPTEGSDFFDAARKHVEEFLPSIDPSLP